MKNLETERLILRPFDESDFEAVHSYASVAENVRYTLSCVNSEERTKQFILSAIRKASEEPCKNYQYAVISKANGKLIGGGNLDLYSDDEAEIGWMLHSDYWKQGLGTEMGACLLRFGFEELGLHRIIAHCDTENYGSYRVMERIGMRREGCFIEGRRASLLSDKKYGDEYSYAILNYEWGANNA